MAERVEKSDREWRRQLTPEQYAVTREKQTEIPFSGKFHDFKADGLYRCVCCGRKLFRSEAKFDSGSGWPSFTRPVSEEAVGTAPDSSYAIERTEVICARCGAHLGHVFDDGPPPDGQRYCINSVALDFVEAKRQ